MDTKATPFFSIMGVWRIKNCCTIVLKGEKYSEINPVDGLYEWYKNDHEGGGYF